MPRTITVRWEVTEQHSKTIEIPDEEDFSIEDDLDDSFLAEHEDNSSWDATTDRVILEITDSNDEKDEN